MGTPRFAKLNPQLVAAPVVLILASGRGERFIASGGKTHKLEALMPEIGGFPAKTVLQTTMDAVIASGLPYHLERGDHAGMGDSIAAAVAKTQNAFGWLILPADLPLIDPKALMAIAHTMQAIDSVAYSIPKQRRPIFMPVINGQQGHPVGFFQSYREELMGLSGDIGAKRLLQTYPIHRIDLEQIDDIQYPEGCVMDVDTLKDLTQLQLIYLNLHRPG